MVVASSSPRGPLIMLWIERKQFSSGGRKNERKVYPLQFVFVFCERSWWMWNEGMMGVVRGSFVRILIPFSYVFLEH